MWGWAGEGGGETDAVGTEEGEVGTGWHCGLGGWFGWRKIARKEEEKEEKRRLGRNKHAIRRAREAHKKHKANGGYTTCIS